MNAITVRIPDDHKSELQQISDFTKRPVSDLVRESVRRYVALERFRQLRNKTRIFAEARGFLTDEDVFDKLS